METSDDPLTIALIAGGTGLAVMAERSKTKQQVALAKYKQKLAIQKAEQIRAADKVAADQRRERKRWLLSKQRVGFAKAGLITTTGTPLTAALNTTARLKYDDIMASHNAEIEAMQQESTADVFGFQAKSAKVAGKFAIGTTLFAGATMAAQEKARFKAAGGGGEGSEAA